MDLSLARTFLAIVDAGNFVAASHRLNVTQSTVSARIRTLEDLVGKTVFNRNNTTCELTPAGQQFYRYARSLVRLWEEARHQIAVPERFSDRLAIAGQYSLWDGFLFDWLPRCRTELPTTAFRVSAGMPTQLMGELLEGVHDLVVLHAPELRPAVVVEELFRDQLILVTADPAGDFRTNYIFMDWGDAFRTMHADEFAALHNPGFSAEMGPLNVRLLLNNRGAGYMPERLVRNYLADGSLLRVSDAPVFPYPAFAVYQDEAAEYPSLRRAVALLQELGTSMRNQGT
ncbi:MAG TPA: LysR family transcriptional regulator [Steroidobacteraceae bacterium]|nr:LysR family transcriptional regulator [Steroidobacteraceae bacterium]HRX89414.1 LysR family transcriptional regulator [Steroidobacteraceae bacterium]